jgi:diguanylate cyclase (GGDEF)-like protein/PAS domain S-box-containing protein
MAMRSDETFYEKLLNKLHDGAVVLDAARRVTVWNEAASALTGFPRDAFAGKAFRGDLLRFYDADGTYLEGEDNPLLQSLDSGEDWSGEGFLRHRDGHLVPVSLRVASLNDLGSDPAGVFVLFSDNSEQVALRRELADLRDNAMIDSETGVASQSYLEMNLVSRLSEASRYGWGFGVVQLAIDGHGALAQEIGEESLAACLRLVANTLLGGSRSSDRVGRWSERDFLVILANVDHDTLKTIAERYRRVIAQSHVQAEGDEITFTVSISAALAMPNDSIVTLLTRSGELLAQSQQGGGNRVTMI